MKRQNQLNIKRGLLSKLVLLFALFLGSSNAWGDTTIFGGTVASGWTYTRMTATGIQTATVASNQLSNYEASSGYYRYYTSNSAISISSGQSIVLNAKLYGTNAASVGYATIKINFSTDNGENWSTVKEFTYTNGDLTNSLKELTFDNITPGTYKIQFEFLYSIITEITLNDAVSTPVLSITHPVDGDAFGYVTTNTTKTYTVNNNGLGSMDVNISSDNSAFTVSSSSLTDITNDGIGKSFDITFIYDENEPEQHTATITITPTFEGAIAQSFTVTAGPEVEFNEDKAMSWTTGYHNIYVKYTASNGWNTICLPISPNNHKTRLFGSTATVKTYAFASYTDGTITFEKANYLYANVPYLVYVENAGSVAFVLENTNVGYKTPGKTSQSSAIFQGTYETKHYQDNDDWYGVTSGGQIMKAGTGAYVKGYRAYFTGVSAPSTTGARISLVIEDDGETTDLGFVRMVDPEAKDIFTLSGQKVEKARKGIYIVNGRKVVIK